MTSFTLPFRAVAGQTRYTADVWFVMNDQAGELVRTRGGGALRRFESMDAAVAAACRWNRRWLADQRRGSASGDGAGLGVVVTAPGRATTPTFSGGDAA